MTIENKKQVNFRFKPKDLLKWKKKARRYSVSLTEYLEKKANADNDKNLFI